MKGTKRRMTPKKPTKKEKERYYLEQFRKVYDDFPAGVVRDGDDQERPDVIIDGTPKIGLDLTNLYHNGGKGGKLGSEPEQAQKRDGVVNEAQNLYLAGDDKNVELTFGFHPISDKRRKKLPTELAAFGKRIENKVSETIILAFDGAPSEVSFAWNAGEYDNATWKPQQVNRVGLMSKERLEKTIRDKEKKVTGYEKCDAYWLLIVVDFWNPAEDQEIRIDDPHVHSDVFERIIIFKTVENRFVTVKR
jgi:hypothetical protein